MTVTLDLLVHADLGLPAGVALVLSSRAAPTTTSPTGQPSNAARILARRQTALAWCGLAWAGCLCCRLCNWGQNRVAAIAQDPGVSLLDLQASQRHQRLSELSQAGDRFLERSDWLASCPPWCTYRGRHWHGADPDRAEAWDRRACSRGGSGL